MDHCFKRQPVDLLRFFSRPSYSNGSNRNDSFRQFQYFYNLICSICCSSKITYSKSFCFGGYAYSLRYKQCINCTGNERKKIVKTWFSISKMTPFIKPVEICTECQNYWSFSNHLLVKMKWSQFHLFLSIPGYNNAVNLHIAGCRCPASH